MMLIPATYYFLIMPLIFSPPQIFSNGNLISVLCGTKEFEELQSTVNPVLFSPPGGCLALSFHSDYSNIKRHTGFRGFYTTQGENQRRNLQELSLCKDTYLYFCNHISRKKSFFYRINHSVKKRFI